MNSVSVRMAGAVTAEGDHMLVGEIERPEPLLC